MTNIYDMYPDVHKRMLPHVRDTVQTYGAVDYNEQNLNQMAQNVVQRSGLNADPPRNHNSIGLNDIARALIIAEILNRSNNPLFLYPFLFRR